MDKFVIKLMKDKEIIGTLFYKSNVNMLYILAQIIIPMVDNYNKNLIGSSLETPVFAARFLLRENEDGTDCENGNFMAPSVKKASMNYLQKLQPGFKTAKGCPQKFGVVGVTADDISEDIVNKNYALIDLDNKSVKINFEKVETKDMYKRRTKKDPSKLPVCPYNYFNLPFNELADLCIFVLDHHVWIYNDAVSMIK